MVFENMPFRRSKQSRGESQPQAPGGAPQAPGGAPQAPGGAPQAPGGAPQAGGGDDPYAHRTAPARAPTEQTGDNVRRVDFNPVARVAGPLNFHTVVDHEAGHVVEAASKAMLFRGYEVILQGRDPRDAVFISSRACGGCR